MKEMVIRIYYIIVGYNAFCQIVVDLSKVAWFIENGDTYMLSGISFLASDLKKKL